MPGAAARTACPASTPTSRMPAFHCLAQEGRAAHAASTISRASTAAGSCARPSATSTRSRSPISSTATSAPPVPTGSGSPTSRSSRRGRGPATSPRSSTPGAAGSSAGAWRPTCATELVTAALDAAIVQPSTGHGSHPPLRPRHPVHEPRLRPQRCRESGIAASMGSVGDCYDNAMAESFFATLETELIDRCDWASPAEAQAAVFDYIEVFYNRIRRHSSLGNLSPEQFEERYRSTGRRRLTHHRPRNRGNSSLWCRCRAGRRCRRPGSGTGCSRTGRSPVGCPTGRSAGTD